MPKEIVMSNSGRNAVVDDDDYDKVKDITWCLDSYGYVVSIKNKGNGKYEKLSLHRVITEAQTGQIVDHIDRDKLNNTKGNLRFASVAENTRNTGPSTRNTTGYKGVRKYKDKYSASITFEGKAEYLGAYDTPEDAAKAYNLKAEEYFGEFAWLNDVYYRGFKPSAKREYSSKYKGVSKNKSTGRWRARAVVNGKEKHIGTFDYEEEAAAAYKEFIEGKEVPGL